MLSPLMAKKVLRLLLRSASPFGGIPRLLSRPSPRPSPAGAGEGESLLRSSPIGPGEGGCCGTALIPPRPALRADLATRWGDIPRLQMSSGGGDWNWPGHLLLIR